MKTIKLLLIAAVIAGLGCAGANKSTQAIQTASASSQGISKSEWVESTLKNMSLGEKAAQLVFVATSGAYMPADSRSWVELERLTRERALGGFVFSIGDVYEYAVQINKLQKLAKIPLLIGCDFEYGAGMRVNNATTFPHLMAVGATRNPKFAYEMGRITAEEGRALGVHQNYAPVVDVNNNPMNPVINTRSFGDDVNLVAEMSQQFVKGTQDGNMIATAKHFPGHGDSDIDTHLSLVTLNGDTNHLQKVELEPFKKVLSAGVMSVMVGHISVPAYDSAPGIPATVSPRLVTGLLEDQLKFGGLIVTDAMRMKGVAQKYGPAESAVLAIKAGIDLVLAPVNADVAVDGIVAAVKRGEISEERIDRSVSKLLKAKQWLGLDKNRLVDLENISNVVGSRRNQMVADEIARNAVTVLGNRDGVLPLPEVDKRSLLDVIISDEEDPGVGDRFRALLRDHYPTVSYAMVDPRSNSVDYDSVLTKARSSDVLLLELHFWMRSGEMTGFARQDQLELIKRLMSLGKPVIAVSFGNPYLAKDFPDVDAYVCAYSDAECMQGAVAEVLFAEQPAKGKLPVSIPGAFKFGEGVEYPKMAMGFGYPEEAGFDSRKLSAVDDTIAKTIKDSAFPGAVLLVARNGIIVRQKAYGTYDYDKYSKQVDVNTIYDLASVSKVIATTSAVMRLVDEGKLTLGDPVVKYIPQFGQNGKEGITLYNLMVHNSGLPAWIKFYEFCNDPQCLLDSVYSSRLVYKTGDSTVYSDLGLITIGKIIEQVSGVPLDKYVDSVFFKPLGMKSTMYNPPPALLDRIAPTEIDTYWKKTGIAVRGRVHDENAAVLGGVAGHAGLFSTAHDLAIFLQMLLNGGTYDGCRYLKEQTVARFVLRQSDKSSRAIGWDTKDSTMVWPGRLLSNKTFLHTGFTGTSVAADPERNLIVVLLTNRVYPRRTYQKIAKVRPKVHDTIVRAIVE